MTESCFVCKALGRSQKTPTYWYDDIDPTPTKKFYACSDCMSLLYKNEEEEKNSQLQDNCDVTDCVKKPVYHIMHEGLYAKALKREWSFRCGTHAGLI